MAPVCSNASNYPPLPASVKMAAIAVLRLVLREVKAITNACVPPAMSATNARLRPTNVRRVRVSTARAPTSWTRSSAHVGRVTGTHAQHEYTYHKVRSIHT